MKIRSSLLLAAAAVAGVTSLAAGQPAEGLAPYFGFQEPRFVKVDDGCGPTAVGDFNGDGRPDLAVVNNRKSRIELYYLRAAQRTAEEQQREVRVNELPPNPWYDRELISVAHRVSAIKAFDVDGDSKPDIVYAGMQPSELVILTQGKSGKFDVLAKQRVRDLSALQDGLAIGDVIGDPAPEIVAMVGDKIHVFPLAKTGRMGEPTILGSGDKIRAVHIEDFNGDGRTDVLAVVPDDPSPLRLWLQSQDPRQSAKAGLLASELRFEMPQIREAQPARFPGRAAASIGVIERISQRLVFFDLGAHSVKAAGADGAVTEREIQAEVTAFTDTGSKGRSVVLADTSGDGLLDLLTNDQKANSVMVYRQQKDIGLSQGEAFSAFKQPKQIDVGPWFDSPTPQVFVLSEEERTVGVSSIDSGRVGFPMPIPMKTSSATPVVMKLVDTPQPMLAVILKDKRDYVLELHQRSAGASGAAAWNADVSTIALKDVRRDPAAIVPYDFDRDGAMDLLILTPGEAMMMVHCTSQEGRTTPDKVMTRETIPQFGLVQAAGPENTALLDADGDGKLELLIADSNYVRFCAYDEKLGWRVVDQVNMPDASTQLVGISLMNMAGAKAAKPDYRIVAADKANSRLLILGRNEAGRWVPRERIRLVGFPVGSIRAGSFAGDGQPGILCLSDDAFALVRLGGQRPKLEEFAAFRSDSENRVEHNMVLGDLNGDGFLDVVVLDAREAMCQILTFSAARKLYQATEFKVFESRLFQRGESRELEPSDAIISDMTGDKKSDLLLQVHDRVIVYPQMSPK